MTLLNFIVTIPFVSIDYILALIVAYICAIFFLNSFTAVIFATIVGSKITGALMLIRNWI